ncbi:MAG: OB-fold domain-containing protein [Proteobacteria bacterium]|nr:OB-fold domain-containing protein [Pseudomonadota bacterium]
MESNRVPVRAGLWKEKAGPDGTPRLIGSECLDCEELFFPVQDSGICTFCQSRNLKETVFSRKGTIYSYTVVMQRPPVYYQGEVPYAIGFVELPEGIRIETLFVDCEFEDLRIGMEVEMVFRTLHTDTEGREVVTYMFRPVSAGGEGGPKA